MAIVTRYFSTSSAGAADGTTWADRAVLFTGGAWSTVITGFDFSGSDSLLCLIGPGTHTVTVALASGLFTNAPRIANPLMLHGCDSSGNQLTSPNPDWRSTEPVDWDSGLPVIATTTSVNTINLVSCMARLIAFTASGRNGAVITSTSLDWCTVHNSTGNSSAVCVENCYRVSNTHLRCSGSSYASVLTSNQDGPITNVRIQGNPSASSGTRLGATFPTSRATLLDRLCIFNNALVGLDLPSASTSANGGVFHCTIANNGTDGIKFANTASQLVEREVADCLITGNGGYGINTQSAARVYVSNCRFRDNTSGSYDSLGNYATGFDIYTTDSDDATEYVDASSTYDFSIKAGATIWASDYGAGRQLDFPAVGNVQNDDTTNGSTGTLTLPATTDVKSGIQYGAGGTEFTGSYSASGGGLLTHPGMSGGMRG